MSAHEYNARLDEGLLIAEYIPGRVRLALGQGNDTTLLELDLELFRRVAVRFLDTNRKENGKTETRPSGRKSRPSEPGVDDL